MDDIIESCEYRGYTIEVRQAYDVQDPFEGGKLGRFAFFDRTRAYENETDLSSDDFDSWEEMQEHIESKRGLDAPVCVPVYIYRHSGDALSLTPFSCTWDSGQLGFALASRQEIRDWLDCKYVRQDKIERADEIVRAQVETLAKHVSGEVYDWHIHKDGEPVEVVGQFCGIEETLKNARLYINGILKSTLSKSELMAE